MGLPQLVSEFRLQISVVYSRLKFRMPGCGTGLKVESVRYDLIASKRTSTDSGTSIRPELYSFLVLDCCTCVFSTFLEEILVHLDGTWSSV